MRSSDDNDASRTKTSPVMKWLFRRVWLRDTGGLACALLFGPISLAGGHNEHPYRHSDVDMPVSLAAHAVRTPEFSTVDLWYDIMIQVKEPLPFQQMTCMMGTVEGPLDLDNCSSDDPLLQADWSVLDGEHVVDRGSIPKRCGCKFENRYMYKFLGGFVGQVGKTYVVEVRFTKDGTPLNLADPHLIVIAHKFN
jgi:hypothetical protein